MANTCKLDALLDKMSLLPLPRNPGAEANTLNMDPPFMRYPTYFYLPSVEAVPNQVPGVEGGCPNMLILEVTVVYSCVEGFWFCRTHRISIRYGSASISRLFLPGQAVVSPK